MLKNLKIFRIKEDMTAPQMARKLGLSYQQYRRLEAGETKATIELAERFNDVFEVDDILTVFKNEVK